MTNSNDPNEINKKADAAENEAADVNIEKTQQEPVSDNNETAEQKTEDEGKDPAEQKTANDSRDSVENETVNDGRDSAGNRTAGDDKNTPEDKTAGDGEDIAEDKAAAGRNDNEQPLIKFEDVGKIYHTGQIVYEALHNVNLEVMEGELVVILGPSGAGKSTLLNLLGGLDGATSGKIFFGGENIAAFDDARLGRFRAVDVGIVFQFYNLVPTLTAYENVDLMRDLGLKIMDPLKALDMVGLADRKDNFPSQLSGGQQQRISIARAIAKMPRLLLCDEPTGALDTKTGKEVLQILQDQSRVHKKTVVMVTHNALFADIADKVVMVKNGTVEDVIMVKDPRNADELSW